MASNVGERPIQPSENWGKAPKVIALAAAGAAVAAVIAGVVAGAVTGHNAGSLGNLWSTLGGKILIISTGSAALAGITAAGITLLVENRTKAGEERAKRAADEAALIERNRIKVDQSPRDVARAKRALNAQREREEQEAAAQREAEGLEAMRKQNEDRRVQQEAQLAAMHQEKKAWEATVEAVETYHIEPMNLPYYENSASSMLDSPKFLKNTNLKSILKKAWEARNEGNQLNRIKEAIVAKGGNYPNSKDEMLEFYKFASMFFANKYRAPAAPASTNAPQPTIDSIT